MEKKKYITPNVQLIQLDSDISLALESNPPGGPGETKLSPEYLQTDPYKNQLG